MGAKPEDVGAQFIAPPNAAPPGTVSNNGASYIGAPQFIAPPGIAHNYGTPKNGASQFIAAPSAGADYNSALWDTRPDTQIPVVKHRRRRRKKQPARHRKRTWLAAILAGFVLLTILAGLFSALSLYPNYSKLYQHDMAEAQDVAQRLRTAGSLLSSLAYNPFDSAATGQAQQQFAAANAEAQSLSASLHGLPASATSLPVYGSRLTAATHLVALAQDASQAGAIGCSLLQTLMVAFHNPLQAHGGGLTHASMNAINGDFQHIESLINAAIGEAILVSPAAVSFNPHLASLLATFQGDIPMARAWMADIDAFLKVAPSVLGIGAPANFLVEILDSTELRPGGGFVGNYGLATISGGRLTAAHITDVDLLDRPFEDAGHAIPTPPQYSWFYRFLGQHDWGLRDSNLSADFPTSALSGEMHYHREGGTVPVQGVIALTPFFIEHILQITGPIAVPEYGEVVTASNLIDKIHYYQLVVGGRDSNPSLDGHSSPRKRFTELLAEHLFARIHQLSTSQLSRTLALLVSSLRTKDVQVFLNQPAAEQLLRDIHLDAAIASPPGDGLFVVDANVSASKVNLYLTRTIEDTVNIDAQGNALHHTTLRYTWLPLGFIYGNHTYTDVIQAYAPPGSTLSAAAGWHTVGSAAAFGRVQWTGYVRVPVGQPFSVTLTWTAHSVIQRSASGCRYQEVIQRQAGEQGSIDQQIVLPASTALAAVQGGLLKSGTTIAILHEPLTEDIMAAATYTC